jgi:hypothetical protein
MWQQEAIAICEEANGFLSFLFWGAVCFMGKLHSYSFRAFSLPRLPLENQVR